MKIFAFIPARYQSTRFPGKPLAMIGEKPMIQHVYERALSCPEISEVCVATDDKRISACVRGFGGQVVMTEKTHKSGTDRICEAASKMGLNKQDLVINIQGDQPLFHPSIVSKLIKPFMDDPSIPMTTVKWKIKSLDDIQNPNHVKVVTDRQGFALYFSRYPLPFFRDAESEQVHFKHLGFYGFRMSFLLKFTALSQGMLEAAEKLEQLRVLENGFKIRVVETPHNSMEVDVPEDVERVKAVLERS
jgi:3-deoxy-manno-octulosonate cytidylyltransferase (CMP-KDO synthetase)